MIQILFTAQAEKQIAKLDRNVRLFPPSGRGACWDFAVFAVDFIAVDFSAVELIRF